MIKRWFLAALLCCVASECFAQAAMRPDQMVARPWAWTGSHENVPRQVLTASGSTFTPPSSFGNYWITTSAGGQTIACPTSILDGDSMSFHIQQGVSAPFTPNITFASPCYGWGSLIQPTWSTGANRVDLVTCFSMNPTDATGASFTCTPQLNAGPSPVRSFVRNGVASATGTSVTLTLSAAAGNSVICATYTGSGSLTSVTDSNSDTFSGFDFIGVGLHEVKLWRSMSIPANVTSFTANIASSVALKIGCFVFNGVTTVAISSGFNSQSPSTTGANNITSSAITSTAGHLLLGINYESVATSSISAGTSPIAFTFATADGTAAAYIISGETAVSPGGSVIATFGNSVALNNFYTDVLDLN